MIEQISIPEERIPVLIGRNGTVLRMLSKKTFTKIKVHDIILIEGDTEKVLQAKDIIAAIGRGFSPKRALMLLGEEYYMEMISLTGETQNTIKRLMGRVIGKKGRSREEIEKKTGAFISVYGKTVAIIGCYPGLGKARRAVEQLINGKTHEYVFKCMAKGETAESSDNPVI